MVDLRCYDLFKVSALNNSYTIKGTIRDLPFLPGPYQIGVYIQSNNITGNFYNLLQFEVVQKKQLDEILPLDLSVRGKIEVAHEFVIN